MAPESGLHVLWECGVAHDAWAGSSFKLQKCIQGQADVIQLFEDLLSRLPTAEFGLFLVQARFIWNQRNTLIHGGKLKELGSLNKRSREYLEEFHQA